MSTLSQAMERRDSLASPTAAAIWQAKLAKGRAQDRRGRAVLMNVVKVLSVAALIAVAARWSHLDSFDVMVQFVVAGGAMITMLDAFQAKRYVIGATFGAVVLLYNPLMPAFAFTGGWQRTLVVISVVPFIVSIYLGRREAAAR